MQLGIVGTGMIVKETLGVLHKIEAVTCAAIYGRTGQSAAQLASQYGIRHCYDDYEKFLQNPCFDTVYIGIINSLHFPFAKSALENGKHVICEKPFTETSDQLRELIRLSRERGLLLMEAVSLLYMPCYAWFAEQVEKLEGIRLIQCNYSQYSSYYDAYLAGNVRPNFDPAKGGGALFDLNIYNLHLVVSLFGKPLDACYYPNRGHNGADTSGVLNLQYPGFSAVCFAAKDSRSPCGAVVQGKNGYVRLIGPPHEFSAADSCIDDKVDTYSGEVKWNRLADEWFAFSDIVMSGDYTRCNQLLDHSQRVMETVDSARKNTVEQ